MVKPVVVVGSLNLDLVARPERAPEPGETVFAPALGRYPGGKGGNQAVAAARLGVPASMVGCVGADPFGDQLLGSLQEAGVQTAAVLRSATVGSGTALITVDSGGQNRIIVIPGANAEVSPLLVDAHADLIRGAAVLLLQLEVPVEACVRAAEVAREAGVPVILDPAPAPSRPLPDALRKAVWLVTPNETEATALTGVRVAGIHGAEEAAQALVDQGFERALVKLGPAGAYYLGPEGHTWVPSFPVRVVDTTAAGDAFAGAVAAALARGLRLEQALEWGSAAGALAVTRAGAQPAMATRAELESLLRIGRTI